MDGDGDGFCSRTTLNRLEEKLVKAIEVDGTFRFSAEDLAGDGAFVRAGLIRAILIGTPVRVPAAGASGAAAAQEETRPVRLQGPGIRVQPAKLPSDEQERRAIARLPIQGRLDLSRLRADGGASLPALELSYCVFTAGIDLSGACVGPLSFEGSHFDAFVACDITVSGGVNLKWCGPSGAGAEAQRGYFPFRGDLASTYAPEPQAQEGRVASLPADFTIAPCTVNLHSAHISGSFWLSYSDFCRVPGQVNPVTGDPVKFAVNLGSANIRDMVVAEQAVILGGISLSGCDVDESVWLTGSRLFGYGDDEAINLQLANIGSVLAVGEASEKHREGFELPIILGNVHALAVNAKEIWLSNGAVCGHLFFGKAKVELGFTLGSYPGRDEVCALNGEVRLDGATIGGGLEFRNISEIGSGLRSVLASEKNPFFSRLGCTTQFFTRVLAPDIHTGGPIVVENSTFSFPVSAAILPAFDVQRARVGGSLKMVGTTLKGGFNLRSSRVGGSILLADTTFDLFWNEKQEVANSRHDDLRTALNLRDCICERELEVRRLRWKRYLIVSPEDEAHQLSFYRNCAVVEQRDGADRYRRLIRDLEDELPPLPIEGASPPIHEFNATSQRLDLSDEQKRADYLTFFCDAISGEEGPFKIVDSIDLPGVELKELREIEATEAAPGGTTGPWMFQATMFYSKALFHAKLKLLPSGMVEMEDDVPVAADLPIGISDRYPSRPDWKSVEPRIQPRAYWGERVEPVVGQGPEAPSVAQTSRTGRQASEVDLAGGVAAKSVAIVDLQGFQCAALIDEFGAEWGFPENAQDRPKIWLSAAGIRCGRVQPAAHGLNAVDGVEQGVDAARSFRVLWTSIKMLLGLKSVDATRSFGAASKSEVAFDAPDKRIVWLSHQFSVRPASNLWPPITRLSYALALIKSWLTGWPVSCTQSAKYWAKSDDFIPQTYDEFATAHYRAGEPVDGQKILVEKKDIQNVITFAAGWRTRFPKGRPGVLARTLLLVLYGLGGVVWWWITGAGADGSTPGVLVPAFSGLALLYAAWPLLLFIIQLLFRAGFRYGLSPSRALATCVLLLALGWAGTHIARTGSLAGTPDWEDYVSRGKKLPEDIALVLSVGFEPSDGEAPDAPAQPAHPGPLRAEGRAVYAAVTPCNVGVTSMLYAADVFIPLLDLDQEDRCTIRAAPDSDRFDRYRWWRIAKALYELVGWIVISLTILTISGVMRRDIER